MKFNLIALAAVAAVAAAAPERSNDHQLEVREEVKVKKLTFYGWDGQAQEVTDADTVFYNDPDVVADPGNKEKRLFGLLLWKKWWWWGRQRCNWCWNCNYHGHHGGCQQGRCCS